MTDSDHHVPDQTPAPVARPSADPGRGGMDRSTRLQLIAFLAMFGLMVVVVLVGALGRILQ